MLSYMIIGGLSLLVLRFLLMEDPPKINKAYSQPGKWYYLKYWVFYVLFNLRKRQNARQKETQGQDAGYGKRSRSSVEDMERPQMLPKEHPKAVDAVYFNGGNAKGEFFVAATARRHDKLVQTLMYLRFPDIGLLELPSLPDTSLKESSKLAYAAGGVRLEVIEPMKTWTLSYHGKMRLMQTKSDKSEEVNVKYSLTWKAYTKYFDFDTDLDEHAMCAAMAREKWSRNFFDQLRVAHQTHYEQFGEISGKVYIEGYGDRNVKLQGVRDHSYGNLRDWKDLYRYAIQYIHLENGTAICIGNICMPRTLSRLIIGYVIHMDGKLVSVSSTDLELNEHGEDGDSPSEMSFNFIAGGQNYHVEVSVQAMPIFYMGHDWEARIHERMCFFKVNGVRGWGISEWDYRNHTGRPAIYNKTKD